MTSLSDMRRLIQSSSEGSEVPERRFVKSALTQILITEWELLIGLMSLLRRLISSRVLQAWMGVCLKHVTPGEMSTVPGAL